MLNKIITCFRAWLDEPIKHAAAQDRVVAAARVLAERITKFQEMGTQHRILVEALDHLDKVTNKEDR